MSQSQPDGYLALPPSGTGRGVLVLHAWWGLNDTVKSVCDRLAQQGYVAFAPDLYHGKIATTIPDAEIFSNEVDTNHVRTQAEVADAAKFLYQHPAVTDPGIAIVCLSLGGYYGLVHSNADPEHVRAVVLFYGTGAHEFSNSQASYLGHFAELDTYEPPSHAAELEELLKRAGRPVTFYIYPGAKHWFMEPERPEAHNPDIAQLAWERTLDFLKRTLTP